MGFIVYLMIRDVYRTFKRNRNIKRQQKIYAKFREERELADYEDKLRDSQVVQRSVKAPWGSDSYSGSDS